MTGSSFKTETVLQQPYTNWTIESVDEDINYKIDIGSIETYYGDYDDCLIVSQYRHFLDDNEFKSEDTYYCKDIGKVATFYFNHNGDTNTTLSSIYRDERGIIENKSTLDEKVFEAVEHDPEFPGGIQEMVKFINENYNTPKKALYMGISGVIYVQFIVSSSGQIRDAEIVKGYGYGCDEEALRVINSMPNWIPGRQNGRAVNVRHMIPIRIKTTPQESLGINIDYSNSTIEFTSPYNEIINLEINEKKDGIEVTINNKTYTLQNSKSHEYSSPILDKEKKVIYFIDSELIVDEPEFRQVKTDVIKLDLEERRYKILIEGCENFQINYTKLPYFNSKQYPFDYLCNIYNLKLDQTNQYIIFESMAWSVSAAIHRYDINKQNFKFIGAGSIVDIYNENDCRNCFIISSSTIGDNGREFINKLINLDGKIIKSIKSN